MNAVIKQVMPYILFVFIPLALASKPIQATNPEKPEDYTSNELLVLMKKDSNQIAVIQEVTVVDVGFQSNHLDTP